MFLTFLYRLKSISRWIARSKKDIIALHNPFEELLQHNQWLGWYSIPVISAFTFYGHQSTNMDERQGENRIQMQSSLNVDFMKTKIIAKAILRNVHQNRKQWPTQLLGKQLQRMASLNIGILQLSYLLLFCNEFQRLVDSYLCAFLKPICVKFDLLINIPVEAPLTFCRFERASGANRSSIWDFQLFEQP